MSVQETKQCQNCKSDFVIEPEDFVFYEKIDVPAPTLCPQCRYQRRIANRNEYNFYKRPCSLCGKDVVTIYNLEYPGPVYCQPCYWSDKWDTLDYGCDFDFSRPFFEQFKEHRFRVPRIALANTNSVNSEYTNQSEENKNCFMIVTTNGSEDCMYGNWNQRVKDCVDCSMVKHCELLYESSQCQKCYRSAFIENCYDVNDSYFLEDCRGCNNCFGCVGLRNKSYCWFNEQLSRKEYEKRLKDFSWTNREIRAMREKFDAFALRFPRKYYHGFNNIDSTGDYVVDNKNARYLFNGRLNHNLTYGQDAWQGRECVDLTETLDNELDYELEGVGWASHDIVLCKGWYSSYCLYSELCFSSSNLFGCVSMKTKKYCIFNKQYSKEDYEATKEKIIEHMKKTEEWGGFFPIEISPFPYNDTIAQDYFPLTKEQVLNRGWRWYDRSDRDYRVTKRHDEIVGMIDEVADDVIKQVISCRSQDSPEEKNNHVSCTTAFRVVPAELRFYRMMNLPIPDRCFHCRIQDRLNRRNPRKLWRRQCVCDYKIYNNTSKHAHHPEGRCPNEFETSYALNREEIVYCESCYQSEVV